MDARGMVRKLVALAAVFSLTFAPALAMAGEIVDGSIPANGLPQAGDVGATWNGSAHKVLRSDADGILRVTEEYPWHLQNDAFTAADTTNIFYAGFLRPFGLGWSVSPFGDRSISITKINSKDARAFKMWFFGSDDYVNWYPVLYPTTGFYVDAASVDTLSITIPAAIQAANTVASFKIALPQNIYFGRYLQLWATSLDSTVNTSYCRVGLTYEGRWK